MKVEAMSTVADSTGIGDEKIGEAGSASLRARAIAAEFLRFTLRTAAYRIEIMIDGDSASMQ